jgi:hypothetical protein
MMAAILSPKTLMTGGGRTNELDAEFVARFGPERFFSEAGPHPGQTVSTLYSGANLADHVNVGVIGFVFWPRGYFGKGVGEAAEFGVGLNVLNSALVGRWTEWPWSVAAMPMSAMSNLANGLIIAAPLPGRILHEQRLGRHTTNAAVLLVFRPSRTGPSS